MIARLISWAIVVLVVAPRDSSAQIRDMGSASPLHVRVHVSAVTRSGDTSRVTFVIENLTSPNSGEDLWQFLIDAPSRLVRVDAGSAGQWATRQVHRGKSTAQWTLEADTLVHPGQSTPPLSFSALGLPGLVTYWAIPDLETHPPVDDERNEKLEPLKGYADSGVTVGVVPVASSSTAADLLARLRGLQDYACGTAGWISSGTICGTLRDKLDGVGSALSAGDLSTAASTMQAFVQQLDAQHGSVPGKQVSDEAYSLLRENAVYLRSRMIG
jgi:hypothetical protein